MNSKTILESLRANARYGGTGEFNKQNWPRWHWDDPRPRPTWQEILDAWEIVRPEVERQEKIETEVARLQAEAATAIVITATENVDKLEP